MGMVIPFKVKCSKIKKMGMENISTRKTPKFKKAFGKWMCGKDNLLNSILSKR